MDPENDFMGTLFGGTNGVVKTVTKIVGGCRTIHRFLASSFNEETGQVETQWQSYTVDYVPNLQRYSIRDEMNGVKILAGDSVGFVPSVDIPPFETTPFWPGRDVINLFDKNFTIIAFESLETGNVISGYTLLCRYKTP